MKRTFSAAQEKSMEPVLGSETAEREARGEYEYRIYPGMRLHHRKMPVDSSHAVDREAEPPIQGD